MYFAKVKKFVDNSFLENLRNSDIPALLIKQCFSLREHGGATRENERYEGGERDEDRKIMSKMSKRWRIRGSFSRCTARAGPIVGPHNTVMI